MPVRPAKDGGHTAFTDHRISRFPQEGSDAPKDRLVPWREPPAIFAKRNLGLASVAVGERDHLTQYLDQGRQLLLEAEHDDPNDPAVLTSLGVVSLRRGWHGEAVELFTRAVAVEPGAAAYYVNLATALVKTGDSSNAIRHLNHAIELDPSLEVAYRRLAEVYRQRNDAAALNEVFQRYLKFRPQSVAAREALRDVP